MQSIKELILNKKDDFLKSIERIAIVGAGLSGIASAKLAKSLGKEVKVTEKNQDISKDSLKILKSLSAELEIGLHSKKFLSDVDLIVLSPGVETRDFVSKYIQGTNKPYVGEIEFSYWFCKSKDIIGVTGTNGKTTTTYVLADILKKNTKRQVHVLGNIGSAFASSVLDIEAEDIVVLEISSFQLETIHAFKPHLACLLNLTQDHLDRYPDMKAYFEAKKRIFLNQESSDFAVFGLSLKDKLRDTQATKLIVEDEDNVSFIKKVAGVYNISESCVDIYFKEFKGLSHRLEFVDKRREVTFINDSKATNVSSTIFALKKVKGPVILIAGGLDKGLDYSLVLPYLDKVKEIVLIGKARGKIKRDLQAKEAWMRL
jgi:UDP-N-acetylmuramoylalanine--D-glutamate ligase